MLTGVLLMFEPIATWDRVATKRPGLVHVFATTLLPLLILAGAAEAYALIHWGKWVGEVPRLKKFPQNEALIYVVIEAALLLVAIFVSVKVINSIGATFHSRHSYSQAFATAVYALTPLLVLRFFDCVPSFSLWVPWGIGIALTVAVLYHGVPRMMDPDPAHAFGLYVMSALILLLSTGAVRFVTAMYLSGRFTELQL